MNDIDNLIATGRIILDLARKLRQEGRDEEAFKLYQRAWQQGMVIRAMKNQL